MSVYPLVCPPVDIGHGCLFWSQLQSLDSPPELCSQLSSIIRLTDNRSQPCETLLHLSSKPLPPVVRLGQRDKTKIAFVPQQALSEKRWTWYLLSVSIHRWSDLVLGVLDIVCLLGKFLQTWKFVQIWTFLHFFHFSMGILFFQKCPRKKSKVNGY